MRLLTSTLILIILTVSIMPPRAEAIVHFGGAIQEHIGCANTVIYTLLGEPRGGEYLWSPTVTTTYSYGPPNHTGQWLLGNAGPSYFCIVSIFPIIVKPGLLMIMFGSSQ